MSGINARGWRGGRSALAVLLVAGVAAGCKDSGLPDRNLPKADAERRTYEYPAYQAAVEPQVWELAGRRWQAGGPVEAIDSTLLRAVASAGGATIYALEWDEEPYDRLFTPAAGGGWQPVEALD